MGASVATEEPLAVQLAAVGLAPELAATLAPSRSCDVSIAADIVDAVRLFAALATQWRRAGMSGLRVGLDYAAAAATAAWLGLAATPELLSDLRVMESEALRMQESRRR